MSQQYKKIFAQILSQELKEIEEKNIQDLIENPPANVSGDLAFPCFSLAKIHKKSPQEIAANLQNKLTKNKDKIIEQFIAVGPYLNVIFNTEHIAQEIITQIHSQKERYGQGESKETTVLVEGWSPNTHKMLHVGHLRNALVSETICTLYEFAGYNVVRSAYGGDIGAHVAKWLWFCQKQDNLNDMPEDPEAFCVRSGQVYAAATALASEEENKEIYAAEIHETQRLLENGDEELQAMWQKTRELSIQGLQNVFDELGCTIQRFYRESEVEQPGIELVKKYEQNNNIPDIKESRGAVIADLEKYDLGVFVLLKSNGTSLYSTKDIALAYLKEEEYSFDQSLYVVATEQNHHFKQLFKTLELVGYNTKKLVHMGYELVELPSGKMSSRKGTIISYHKRRDDAIAQAMTLLEGREIENKQQVAHGVAFGALKFSMLLQDTYKKIRLDMDKALSFDGETGPYLQYTYARLTSLLKKGEHKPSSETTGLGTPEEHALLLQLSQFGDSVIHAVAERKPSIIARYTLELCHLCNSYYSNTTIISEDKQTTQARLQLISAIQQVLGNGLRLLGIETLEQM